MYLLELHAITDSVGTATTLRVGTETYVTGPADTPPNQCYDGVLLDAGTIKRSMFSDITTGGASSVGYGDMVIANTEGAYDAWRHYGFDGQLAKLYHGPPGSNYSAVTVAHAFFDLAKITLQLRDPLETLNKPLLKTKYLGDNVLPDGLEGLPSDLKGKIKSRIYGSVFNITPDMVNTAKLIYEVSDSAVYAIPKVKDRGAQLTNGGDYATLSDLLSTAPSPGYYRAYLPLGLFRLGASPTGEVTADVVQGATSAARTAAQIIKQIALDAGISSGLISSTDVAAMDAANSAECGIVVDGDTSAVSVMDAIATSINAWYGFDSAGLLRMGVFHAPTGTAAYRIIKDEVISLERVPSNDTKGGIPAYRVTVSYAKNYTVQTSDLAGVVTDIDKGFLKEEFRKITPPDNTAVLTKHALAPEIKRETQLVNAADASVLANNLLALYSQEWDVFEVKIQKTSATAVIDLGVEVALEYPRFELDSGKCFIVLNIDEDFNNDQLTLVLWGGV